MTTQTTDAVPYETAGVLADGSTVAMQDVGGLSLDAAGNLFVSDDPSAGNPDPPDSGHVPKQV